MVRRMRKGVGEERNVLREERRGEAMISEVGRS